MLINFKLRLLFSIFNLYLSIQFFIENISTKLDLVRDKYIEKMFAISSVLYLKFARIKRKSWTISQHDLQFFPEDSLGKNLYYFLKSNNFTIQAKAENHDIFHILSGFKPIVKEELALQFFLLGNGKRSFYLILAISTACILTPDRLSYFIKAYKKGKKYRAFHHWNFEYMLHENFNSLQDFIQYKPNNPTINL